MNTDSSDPAFRGFLAGQGFGSMHCHLEPHPTNTVSAVYYHCMCIRSPSPLIYINTISAILWEDIDRHSRHLETSIERDELLCFLHQKNIVLFLSFVHNVI